MMTNQEKLCSEFAALSPEAFDNLVNGAYGNDISMLPCLDCVYRACERTDSCSLTFDKWLKQECKCDRLLEVER